MSIELHLGDCREVMATMPANSIDSIVTDPPAGIAFMNKSWDKDKGGRRQWVAWMTEIAAECLRVIRPGGHALVWALPRTSHWTATAWEDAGFEVRDCIYHIFGSGFPKSHNVSAAIDKHLGAEREVIGQAHRKNDRDANSIKLGRVSDDYNITAPATDEAKQFSGWGTALKPSVECWFLLRKPLSESTVAANVLRWGVGGLNIDQCRVGTDKRTFLSKGIKPGSHNIVGSDWDGNNGEKTVQGRWPANLILDEEAGVLLDEMSGVSKSSANPNRFNGLKKFNGKTYASDEYSLNMESGETQIYADQGGASRFFLRVAHDEDDAAEPKGRWPANLILDEEAAAMLDEQSGDRPSSGGAAFGSPRSVYGHDAKTYTNGNDGRSIGYGDQGGASRFFKVVQHDKDDVPSRMAYVPKASKRDRNSGVEELITWDSAGLSQETEQLLQLAKGISDDTMRLLEGYEWNTMLSGSNTTGQFQRDFSHTISILTRLITELRTLNYSPSSNIRGCILDAIREMTAHGLSLAESVEHINQLIPNSTNEKDVSLPGAVSAALKMLLQISAKGRTGNTHSTVKPTALMRYLVRLVTPKGGTVLDHFCGSGSTGKAAVLEGFNFVGIELDAEYLAIAEKRIAWAAAIASRRSDAAQAEQHPQLPLLMEAT